ncbi:hypothetical protein Q8A73_012675 [Channa argus]|nr:hypothetical protein Q8A73_012675 [Channa argus]
MEVTAVCISLSLTVLLLLDAHGPQHQAGKSDAAFLHIVPTRLQFFEYESIFLTCQEFTDSIKWRGVRNIERFIPTCTNSTVTQTHLSESLFSAQTTSFMLRSS